MFEAKIYTNNFNRIISATKGFVPSSTLNGNILTNYIKLEFDAEKRIVTAVAIDGYRLSTETAELTECKESFVAYVRPSVKLPKGEYATIRLDNDYITISCNEFLCGYKQPKVNEMFDWRKAIPAGTPVYRIGFDANLLLSALQAAKASVGNVFKAPVVLEFRNPTQPIILKPDYKSDNIKLVMPMRLRGE